MYGLFEIEMRQRYEINTLVNLKKFKKIDS